MKNHAVYCQKCAYLLLIKTKKGALPLCVATADFIDGPLRKRVDIKGVCSAVARNFSNECEYFKLKIFAGIRVRDLKDWARRSINASTAKISDYSTDQEVEETRRVADEILEKVRKHSTGVQESPGESAEDCDEDEGFDPDFVEAWRPESGEQHAEEEDDQGGLFASGAEGGLCDGLRSEHDPDGDEEVEADGDSTEVEGAVR